MESVANLSSETCRKIQVVFADIDDTISSHGKILPEAYQALWHLSRAGIKVVPVTGRCAGWVDHIARMWPVEGVVGENGAFYFFMGPKKLEKRYYYPPDQIVGAKKNLEKIREKVLARFPELKVASDQPYREFDLAIDFCEDVPPQSWEVIDEIVRIFQNHGATTKVSSIHVNGWFGDFDKLTMCKRFAQERLNLDLDIPKNRERCTFIGDSANDEPMFKFFPTTIGVANIDKFVGRLEYFPAYRCENEGGLGFAEFVKVLLNKRKD